MNRLHRIDAQGRLSGFIVQDRPLEAYSARTDLVAETPPDAPIGYTPYWQVDHWVLVQDPPPQAGKVG